MPLTDKKLRFLLPSDISTMLLINLEAWQAIKETWKLHSTDPLPAID